MNRTSLEKTVFQFPTLTATFRCKKSYNNYKHSFQFVNNSLRIYLHTSGTSRLSKQKTLNIQKFLILFLYNKYLIPFYTNSSISKNVTSLLYIYQCCGSGMFIPDPTFFHPGPDFSIPDPGSTTLPVYNKKAACT